MALPARCVLDLTIEDNRRASWHATRAEHRWPLRHARHDPAIDARDAGSGQDLRRAAACDVVDVIARPPLHGSRGLRRSDRWRYCRAAPLRPARGRGRALVTIADVVPPARSTCRAFAAWVVGPATLVGPAATPVAGARGDSATPGGRRDPRDGIRRRREPDASFSRCPPSGVGSRLNHRRCLKAGSRTSPPDHLAGRCRASRAAPVCTRPGACPGGRSVYGGCARRDRVAAPIPNRGCHTFFDLCAVMLRRRDTDCKRAARRPRNGSAAAAAIGARTSSFSSNSTPFTRREAFHESLCLVLSFTIAGVSPTPSRRPRRGPARSPKRPASVQLGSDTDAAAPRTRLGPVRTATSSAGQTVGILGPRVLIRKGPDGQRRARPTWHSFWCGMTHGRRILRATTALVGREPEGHDQQHPCDPHSGLSTTTRQRGKRERRQGTGHRDTHIADPIAVLVRTTSPRRRSRPRRSTRASDAVHRASPSSAARPAEAGGTCALRMVLVRCAASPTRQRRRLTAPACSGWCARRRAHGCPLAAPKRSPALPSAEPANRSRAGRQATGIALTVAADRGSVTVAPAPPSARPRGCFAAEGLDITVQSTQGGAESCRRGERSYPFASPRDLAACSPTSKGLPLR